MTVQNFSISTSAEGFSLPLFINRKISRNFIVLAMILFISVDHGMKAQFVPCYPDGCSWSDHAQTRPDFFETDAISVNKAQALASSATFESEALTKDLVMQVSIAYKTVIQEGFADQCLWNLRWVSSKSTGAASSFQKNAYSTSPAIDLNQVVSSANFCSTVSTVPLTLGDFVPNDIALYSIIEGGQVKFRVLIPATISRPLVNSQKFTELKEANLLNRVYLLQFDWHNATSSNPGEFQYTKVIGPFGVGFVVPREHAEFKKDNGNLTKPITEYRICNNPKIDVNSNGKFVLGWEENSMVKLVNEGVTQSFNFSLSDNYASTSENPSISGMHGNVFSVYGRMYEGGNSNVTFYSSQGTAGSKRRNIMQCPDAIWSEDYFGNNIENYNTGINNDAIIENFVDWSGSPSTPTIRLFRSFSMVDVSISDDGNSGVPVCSYIFNETEKEPKLLNPFLPPPVGVLFQNYWGVPVFGRREKGTNSAGVYFRRFEGSPFSLDSRLYACAQINPTLQDKEHVLVLTSKSLENCTPTGQAFFSFISLAYPVIGVAEWKFGVIHNLLSNTDISHYQCDQATLAFVQQELTANSLNPIFCVAWSVSTSPQVCLDKNVAMRYFTILYENGIPSVSPVSGTSYLIANPETRYNQAMPRLAGRNIRLVETPEMAGLGYWTEAPTTSQVGTKLSIAIPDPSSPNGKPLTLSGCPPTGN